MNVRAHEPLRRLGRAAGRAGQQAFGALLDVVLPAAPDRGVEALSDVRSVLLVRPNFRMGNLLMARPLVQALAARFPAARIDVLCGDTTARLLDGLPIGRVYCVSRRHVARPWRFAALFLRLRRERYDLAIDGGVGSFSGGLYAYLTGARQRLGREGKASRFLTIRLPETGYGHAYDDAMRLARDLGAECSDRPLYQVDARAAAAAAEILRARDLASGEGLRPFAALFVGGHEDKRWPIESWVGLAAALNDAGVRLLVLIGPEERHVEQELRAALPSRAHVLPPQSLKVFAALLDAAALVVTPDSGPMHLAVAVGTPTIALLQSSRSEMYAPRGAADRSLLRPTVGEVVAAVLDHPVWTAAPSVRRA